MEYPDHIWSAVYEDGTLFQQFDPETHEENAYKDIDRRRLKCFILSRLTDSDDGMYQNIFRLELKPGQSLIYRKRHLVRVINEAETREHLYLIGYRENGKRVIAYIHPDGYIEIDDDRGNLELLPFEENDNG